MSDQASSVGVPFWGDVTDTEALRRYRTLVDAVDDGIYQLDAEGNFVGVNETIVETTGYGRQELLGAHVSMVLDDADVERIEGDLRERFESGDDLDGVSYETTVETADGERLSCDLQISLLVSDGEFRGSIGVVRDVTERKRYEHRLEVELDEVFDRITDGFVALDTDWNITHVNERGREIIEADGRDLVGKNLWEEYPDIVGTRFETAYRRAMETQEPTTIQEYYPPFDGWFEEHIYPSETGLSVYFKDVTEQKGRERELERALDLLDRTERIADVGGWEVDTETMDVFWTDHIFDLLGVDADEEPPLDEALDMYHDEDKPVVEDAVEAALAAGESFDVEARIRTANGEIRWLRLQGVPETVDGDVVTLRGAAQDVTERKERERELERNNEQLETLFEVLPVGVVVAEADGEIVEANGIAHEIWGGDVFDADSVAEYERYPVRWAESGERVDPEEMTLARVIDGEAVTEPDVFEIETFDGERRIVQAEGMPIRDEFGEVTRGVVTMSDVTERREAQRRLAESERLYRTLADRFPNGVVGVYDDDLRYTLAAGEKIGDPAPSREEVEGTRMPDLYPDDAVADLEPLFRAAVEDGETNSVQTEVVGRHWRVWATPLRNADGEIFAGLSFAQDITGQIERERELERYETIVETVNDGVYVVDADGTFQMVNETYAEMLGYSPDELVGTDAAAVLEGDDVVERVEELHAATAEGHVEQPSMEGTLRTAEGERLPVEATFAPLPDDDESDWHRVGVVRDISERKQRRRALEESERRYRTLVEHFPNGAVGLFDENLEYTAVGGELLDTTGVDPEDRIGDRVDDIYPDGLVEEIEPYFQAALDGEANSFEAEYHSRHLYAHTLPIRNADDEVYAGMLVVQDVTERREYERMLEESNERLEQFAYAASHDLQEPLRMVSSYLQLIENRYGDELDENGREFLAFAVDGADRMQSMIEGLLQYSRVETQGGAFEPVDLESVLADATENLQVKIEEQGAEITIGSLPRVEGDEGQLRQVFQNLLSNAIEYSGDEPPRVRVSAERNEREVSVSVSDDGIGIDPDDQERIFEVFQRVQGDSNESGSGIGLALCERIVERHGGNIRVDSEPGEGATFSFALPAAGEGTDD